MKESNLSVDYGDMKTHSQVADNIINNFQHLLRESENNDKTIDIELGTADSAFDDPAGTIIKIMGGREVYLADPEVSEEEHTLIFNQLDSFEVRQRRFAFKDKDTLEKAFLAALHTGAECFNKRVL